MIVKIINNHLRREPLAIAWYQLLFWLHFIETTQTISETMDLLEEDEVEDVYDLSDLFGVNSSDVTDDKPVERCENPDCFCHEKQIPQI